MKNTQLRTKGVRVNKNESTIEALKNSVPHWIHHTEDDPKYFGGKKYLPMCDCSECGYTSNVEHSVCPKCGAKMHQI